MLDRALLIDNGELPRVAMANLCEENNIICDCVKTVEKAADQFEQKNYSTIIVSSETVCLPSFPEFYYNITDSNKLPFILLHPDGNELPELAEDGECFFATILKPVRNKSQAKNAVKRAITHYKNIMHIDRLHKELEQLKKQLREWQESPKERYVRSVEIMREENTRLTAVDRMKNSLLSHICHELRSPLVSVRGYNELFYRGHLCEIPPEYLGYFEVCLRNIDKLQALIESLAAHVELSQEFRHLKIELCDMAEKIDNCIETYRQSDRIPISMAQPSFDVKPIVEVDAEVLHHAICGIIRKLDELSCNKGEITVSMSVVDANVLKVSFSNNELFIPPQRQSEIFTPPDTNEPRAPLPGVPLTLYQSRDFLRLIGSELRFSSQDGRGTSFYFNINIVTSE